MLLEDVSRVLSTKRSFMVSFMERYVLSQIHVARNEMLANQENFDRVIDFCLHTRQRIRTDELRRAKRYFHSKFADINGYLENDEWNNLQEVVYSPPTRVGVGQKIGSLILEMLIHYGEANHDIEPHLLVPIDTHVRRIFTDCLHLDNVPSVGEPTTSNRYQSFQELLATQSAERIPRIVFDYLWFIGKVFCTKASGSRHRYSRGYRLCSMCWIKGFCVHEDKWTYEHDN